MDREISKEERLKIRRGRMMRCGAVVLGVGVVLYGLVSVLRPSIKREELTFAVVDEGAIEVSVGASGKVVPAFEEIILSPINTRIVQVYSRSGDLVEEGTPLLKLDLQSTETAYRKMLDEEQMRRCQLEQLRIDNQTFLSDLKMKVKICAMNLDRMEVELRNERYLDSMGSGTTDRVRQAELAYDTGKLELEQLRQMYENGQQVKKADLKVKELEFRIFQKELAEMKRTLEDAEIRSPRKAVLTFINNQVGAQILQGEQVAVISDLSHFKVECEIADGYGDRVAVGSRTVVMAGRQRLTGVVSNLTPQSKNGIIAFTVQLDRDNDACLRSGLRVDVHVMNALKERVLRLQNAPYYAGAGEYDLFVLKDKDRLVRRRVRLGESSFERVEVIEGLHAGDKVVISNMTDFKEKKTINIK